MAGDIVWAIRDKERAQSETIPLMAQRESAVEAFRAVPPTSYWNGRRPFWTMEEGDCFWRCGPLCLQSSRSELFQPIPTFGLVCCEV
jgi:hypothetical protein